MQCMNRMIVDEYFVNLAKIIDGNLPQSARSQLPENLLRALISQFDVPGTTNCHVITHSYHKVLD